jgi:DNA-binding PadR family transcriptional regulator
MTKSLKVPFYILGFLIRLGRLHGYQLKKHIEQEASDFAQIRLPNLYYHLASMKKNGWVTSDVSRQGNRPEKEVFSITEQGKRKFRELFDRCLVEITCWDFPLDGVLFFSKGIPADAIVQGLATRKKQVEAALVQLSAHTAVVLKEVPAAFADLATLILSHHELHYRTEVKWLLTAIDVVKERAGKQGGIS